VLIYFRRDLGRLTVAALRSLRTRRPFETTDSRLAWFVVLGTIPIGVAGLLFKKAIETQLRSLYVIAGSLMALAVVLFVFERIASHRRTLDEMTLRDGLVIGLWQCLALVPGASRSGTTITGGLSLGLKREDAARYSFLLSIPATTLAGLFELKHFLQAPDKPPTAALVVATVVAFASGLGAIAGLLRYLRTRTTVVFVVYRLLLGGALLALLFAGVLSPRAG
jgi:undecaprenyl-diphosphatase